MTIDEAIKYYQEAAKECRDAALSYARSNAYETALSCKECGQENERLAMWLTELLAYRATDTERMRWIPCSERLPGQGERVIVAIFGSDMIMPNEGETLQDAIERSRKEGYITVGFICSDGWYGADWFPLMVHPSFWMPKPDLPEPPESELQRDHTE